MILDISLEEREETDFILRIPRIDDSIIGNNILEGLFFALIDVAQQQVKGVTGIQIDFEDAYDFIQLRGRHFLQKFQNDGEKSETDNTEYVEWLLKIKEKYKETCK